MSSYWNLLASGFALGVWRGLLEGAGMVEQWFAPPDARLDERPLWLLSDYPWLRLVALAGWLALAATWSITFRGFRHTAGMPLGLYLIGKIPVANGTMIALTLAEHWKLPEKRTRTVLTVIGVTLAVASCVPMMATDPCQDPDVYCD